jgi:acyl-CoA synthetase (AMP-forming)/AMP-acid ligase II/acyl carrier protein
MVGGQVFLLNDEQCNSVEFICYLMSAAQVNCVQATPSRWKLLLMQSWLRQASLTVISGGEALTSDLAAKLWTQQGDFWNLYGPTETTIWAMAQRVNAELIAAEKSLPEIGITLPHMKSVVVQSQDAGENRGELFLSGQGLATGYFRDLALTEKQFEWRERVQMDGALVCERWYHTGDLVQQIPDNSLAFLGRLDRQVKLNGYRIELTEIEVALKRHTSVADVVLLLETVPYGNTETSLLTACVVAVEGSHNKTAEKLNAFLSRSLPDYMLPARYRFLEHIPLNANGKTDYHALSSTAAVPPDSTGEEIHGAITGQIKSRICDLLELKEIGLHDSFFDLGGSSVLAAVLLMSINNDYGIGISLATMLARPPTLARLVLLVEKHAGTKGNLTDADNSDLYQNSVATD